MHFADDSHTHTDAEPRDSGRREAQTDQCADADGQLDLARTAFQRNPADDVTQCGGCLVSILKITDLIVGTVRKLQYVADCIDQPEAIRGFDRRRIWSDFGDFVVDFAELVVELMLQQHHVEERFRDFAAYLEGKRVLDFPQCPLGAIHFADFKAFLAKFDLHLITEDAQRLENLIEAFARIAARPRTILYGIGQSGASLFQFVQNSLEFRAALQEAVHSSLWMSVGNLCNGIYDGSVKLGQLFRAGDVLLDFRDGLLRRFKHSGSTIQIPVAAGRGFMLRSKLQCLAIAILQVRPDTLYHGLLDCRIMLYFRYDAVVLLVRDFLSIWNQRANAEIRHRVQTLYINEFSHGQSLPYSLSTGKFTAK